MNNLKPLGLLALTAAVTTPATIFAKSASSPKRPNIIFIITDQQSADAVSAYKDIYPEAYFNTPNMDRLANNGISFTNTYCSNPVSAPSRFTIFTGQVGSQYNVRANSAQPYDGDKIVEMLPEYGIGNIFLRNGYETYYGGKVHLPCSAGKQNEKNMHEAPVGYGFTNVYTTDEREIAGQLAADIIREKIASPEEEKPFFLVASFINPHDICMEGVYNLKPMGADDKQPGKKQERMECVREIREKIATYDVNDFYKNIAPQLPSNFEPTVDFPKNGTAKIQTKFPDDYWQRYRWMYGELTTLVDSHIGLIIDAVESDPTMRDNTIIVLTSDHGEMQGAHRMITKGFPYDECQKVPLIISGSMIKNGDRDNTRVCNGYDILPTLCGLANIEAPECVGVSLSKRVLGKGKVPARDKLVLDGPSYYSVLKGDYKYSYFDTRMQKPVTTENELLVDLKKDRGEMQNIADDNSDVIKKMKAYLPK